MDNVLSTNIGSRLTNSSLTSQLVNILNVYYNRYIAYLKDNL